MPRKLAERMVCRDHGYVGDLGGQLSPVCPKCGRLVRTFLAEMRWYRYRRFCWWNPLTWFAYYWGFVR